MNAPLEALESLEGGEEDTSPELQELVRRVDRTTYAVGGEFIGRPIDFSLPYPGLVVRYALLPSTAVELVERTLHRERHRTLRQSDRGWGSRRARAPTSGSAEGVRGEEEEEEDATDESSDSDASEARTDPLFSFRRTNKDALRGASRGARTTTRSRFGISSGSSGSSGAAGTASESKGLRARPSTPLVVGLPGLPPLDSFDNLEGRALALAESRHYRPAPMPRGCLPWLAVHSARAWVAARGLLIRTALPLQFRCAAALVAAAHSALLLMELAALFVVASELWCIQEIEHVPAVPAPEPDILGGGWHEVLQPSSVGVGGLTQSSSTPSSFPSTLSSLSARLPASPPPLASVVTDTSGWISRRGNVSSEWVGMGTGPLGASPSTPLITTDECSFVGAYVFFLAPPALGLMLPALGLIAILLRRAFRLRAFALFNLLGVAHALACLAVAGWAYASLGWTGLVIPGVLLGLRVASAWLVPFEIAILEGRRTSRGWGALLEVRSLLASEAARLSAASTATARAGSAMATAASAE